MKDRYKIFLAIVILTGLLIGCTAAPSKEESVPVLLDSLKMDEKEKTIPVVRMDVVKENTIDVIVVPKTEQLFFGMDGEVLSVAVVAGQTVEEGDVLATISQTYLMESIAARQEEIDYLEASYSLQLEQAKKEIKIAEKELSMLQTQYEEQEKIKQEAAQNIEKNQSEGADLVLNESSTPMENYENLEESSQIQSAEGESHGSSDLNGSEENSQNSVVEDQNSQNSSVTEDQNSQNSSVTEEAGDQNSSMQEPIIQEPIIQKPEITQFDLQLAELSLQEVKLSYNQLLEEYNLEMSQRKEELEALLNQKGEDVLTAPFSGRIVEVNCMVGSFVQKQSAAMLIVDESQKVLKGRPYSNISLKAKKDLLVLFDEEVLDVTYIPYDDQEYSKRAAQEELPSWFAFDCPDHISFGDEGMIKIILESSEDTLAVPVDCVFSDNSGKFVYMSEAGKRVKAYVTLGVASDNYVEITKGLAEGDEIYGIE